MFVCRQRKREQPTQSLCCDVSALELRAAYLQMIRTGEQWEEPGRGEPGEPTWRERRGGRGGRGETEREMVRLHSFQKQ